MHQWLSNDLSSVNYSPFLVLDLGLNVVYRVRRLDFERDGLSGKGLHKDLHL